jgi:7-keto-8-aminopelargonate synthetase-like enzyme
MKDEPSSATWLAAQLSQETRGHVTAYKCARNATELAKLARRAHSIAVRACNFPDVETEKPRARIKAAANAILQDYSASVLSLHTDPRGGFGMIIKLASGAKNGWADGWGL